MNAERGMLNAKRGMRDAQGLALGVLRSALSVSILQLKWSCSGNHAGACLKKG